MIPWWPVLPQSPETSASSGRDVLLDKSGKLFEGDWPGRVIGSSHGDVLFFHGIAEQCQGIPSGRLLAV